MAEPIVTEELETQQSVVADEPQADGQEALSSVLDSLTDEAADAQQEPTTDTQPAESGADDLREIPKSLRGRIKGAESRGYERGKREVEEQYRKDLEELAEMRLSRDAKELAEKEKISESLATRLLRAERGMAAPANPAPESESPTQRKASVQPTVEERAQTLFNQAKTIQRATGVDPLEVFNSDPEAHRKVVSGEWDMADVAKAYAGRGHVPAPARATGQNRIEGRSISDLSDAEFARLDKLLDDHTFNASS